MYSENACKAVKSLVEYSFNRDMDTSVAKVTFLLKPASDSPNQSIKRGSSSSMEHVAEYAIAIRSA